MRLTNTVKLIIAVAGLLILTTATSLAFFYSEQEIDNEFRTTEANVTINEKFVPLDGWVPGEEKQKEVSLGNEGEIDAVIRIRFESEVKFKDGTKLNDSEILDDFVLNFTDEFSRDWIKGTDGWYYYSRVLSPGENTPVTLKSVTMSSNIGSSESGTHKDYQESVFTINVNSEMLQVSTAHEAAAYYNWAYHPKISGKDVSWFE